jgi:hypothetical protein
MKGKRLTCMLRVLGSSLSFLFILIHGYLALGFYQEADRIGLPSANFSGVVLCLASACILSCAFMIGIILGWSWRIQLALFAGIPLLWAIVFWLS